MDRTVGPIEPGPARKNKLSLAALAVLAASLGVPTPVQAQLSPSDVLAEREVGAPVTDILAQGMFRDADRSHRGEGSATIVRQDDGSLILEMRNFKVTNGPGLHVVLSDAKDPRSEAALAASTRIDLGDLRSERGDQDYPIPADVDVTTIASVVIYCQPYDVLFSIAPLDLANPSRTATGLLLP